MARAAWTKIVFQRSTHKTFEDHITLLIKFNYSEVTWCFHFTLCLFPSLIKRHPALMLSLSTKLLLQKYCEQFVLK